MSLSKISAREGGCGAPDGGVGGSGGFWGNLRLGIGCMGRAIRKVFLIPVDRNGKTWQQLFEQRRHGMWQRNDGEILFEIIQFFDQISFRIVDDAAAVEYDLRLAAYCGAIVHGKMVFQYILPDHFFAILIVIIVKRRGGDIDHHVGVLSYQVIHGADPVQRVISYIPDVLADGEGDLFAFEWYHLPFKSGFEIAVFVKDIVVGQAGLVGYAFDLFFVEQPGGIKEVLAFSGEITGRAADNYTDGVRLFFDPVESCITFRDKIFELQEITGWVAANGKLGENDQVGAGLFGMTDAFEDLTGILFKIPDVIVLLRQRYFHPTNLRQK
jgi:hypothetical protein